MKLRLFFFSIIILLMFLFIENKLCFATEDHAKRTGKVCAFCHQNPNGGALNPTGIAYIRNNYTYPIPEPILNKSHELSTPFYRTVRLIVGYIHLAAACILVGVIFFVRLFVKPASLRGGIPKGERILGLTCISNLLLTGLYLTWYRLDSLSAFFQSHFGVLLFIKLVLFAIMLTLALLAVILFHKRMRQQSSRFSAEQNGFSIQNLSKYDGKEGRPAYVLYKNVVYDVTNSPKWKAGTHFQKHAAGQDMTKALEGAPHDDEVFTGLPIIAKLADGQRLEAPEKLSGVRKWFVGMAYTNSILVFLILLCVAAWRWGVPVKMTQRDQHRRDMIADTCTECHKQEKPGIYADWQKSMHAKVGVSCADCHRVSDNMDLMVSQPHLNHSDTPVSALVTPKRCAQCHPDETEQYARSKHAHTLEIINKIDKWLIHGMINRIERATGCYACHGSVIQSVAGEPMEGSWPNVGVGRRNPDGSLGSCTSCHTRHRFSSIEARKPEACGQCHLGPDHPQIEIYTESKHGAIYHAEGDQWNWNPNDFHWIAGRDYRTPTCAGCHMSEAQELSKSHDVTERLAWELQAPLTIRPSEFTPFPSNTSWEMEREKMGRVCLQCHSQEWTSGHFQNLDRVIENYNTIYYTPVVDVLNDLYASGVLSQESYFDEKLEWEFYELWHHEGRRARMGTAMMAPDYAWWHGFYEVKHRYVTFMEEAKRLKEEKKASKKYTVFPGKYRDQ